MVVVTTGANIQEQMTRAKTRLILILVEPGKEVFKKWYTDLQENIKAAAVEGLVDMQVIEKGNQIKRRNENKSGCSDCCNVM